MDERRRFSDSERAALYLAADGRCTECGEELEPGWHADHIDPWSHSRNTNVTNGQALCPQCNLRKGNRMARSLLAWQEDALKKYGSAGSGGQPPARFLLAAFPAMGKTEAAAAILASTGRFGIVLVYQADTLTSWRSTLHGRGICAATVSKTAVSHICAACGKPAKAAVMTYHFGMAHPDVIVRLFAKRGPCLLIPDEVHHLRSERALGVPLVAAQPYINAVLTLSATPFRTDEEPVPFVHTDGPWTREPSLLPGHCIVDIGYGRALTQKPPCVTRSVFERYDADVRWLEGEEGSETEKSAILSQKAPADVARKARRHAVNPRGAWLPAVLQDADATLNRIRATDRRGGGLIICRDTDHAVAVADLHAAVTDDAVTVYTEGYSTRQHRVGAGRRSCADCDTPFDHSVANGRACPSCGSTEYKRLGGESGDVRAAYEKGDVKWMVTVRKVSEGVDIQRLRVLIYATVTRTPLFFVQALGRVIRVRRDLPPEVDQTAWVYIPDDEIMRGYAQQIENDIADAEIAAYEEDDDSTSDRDRKPSLNTERFLRADPEYSGSIAGGVIHDPELTALAAELDEPAYDALRVLRKLRDSGRLNMVGSAPASSTEPEQGLLFDPADQLAKAIKEKDEAVRSWAGLWLRHRPDLKFGDAARICHSEVNAAFGVGSWEQDITVHQVEKATAYARERIRDLRHG